MSTVTREKFMDYVAGDRTNDSAAALNYYLKLFDTYYKNDNSEKKWFLAWNWYAFCFGPIWMAYRGMFWVSVGFIMGYKILEFANPAMQIVGGFLLWLLLGLYGNAIYLQHLSYLIKADKTEKKGIDITMAVLVFVLFTIELANLIA